MLEAEVKSRFTEEVEAEIEQRIADERARVRSARSRCRPAPPAASAQRLLCARLAQSG